jgi:hypothetical protein
MNQDRKRRLIELGAEALAEVLLELAVSDDAANDLVERMIATPKDNVKRYKAKLAGLRRRRRFVPWGKSSALARELIALLEDLRSGVEDPRTGVELVTSFYEADDAILGQCDDSSGNVGDVFQFVARDLFVSYATRCEDKEWLGDLVLRVQQTDDYGVRDVLMDSAAQYLPEPVLRSIIERLQYSADRETDEIRKRHFLIPIESLAKQLKDAPLFEKTRIASWGKLSTAACIDIARVYLEADDPMTALSWLERIPEEETFHSGDRNHLLNDVYGRLGQREKQTEIAWKIFRGYRCPDTLGDLLGAIGEEERQGVIAGETELILKSEELSHSDAAFMIEMGRMDEAEGYLLARADQLDGGFYGSLLPLGKAMEADGRRLAATVIYRALLDSILERGQTKAYLYGARYLRKLDRLAEAIDDWADVEPHADYVTELREAHGRKSSFWSRYEKSG